MGFLAAALFAVMLSTGANSTGVLYEHGAAGATDKPYIQLMDSACDHELVSYLFAMSQVGSFIDRLRRLESTWPIRGVPTQFSGCWLDLTEDETAVFFGISVKSVVLGFGDGQMIAVPLSMFNERGYEH